ncbi:hypothetical protein GCM10009828_030490 [Actinoplanes couchii]|uniref:Uncharacterized protein n=1 Tax=Actinoplanes couchii TaxID=403638 RepID=A0ABQ3XC00_9ACTN|nr:hypothetical protein Aco03nite_043870 [Actinoplanes couchii]
MLPISSFGIGVRPVGGRWGGMTDVIGTGWVAPGSGGWMVVMNQVFTRYRNFRI